MRLLLSFFLLASAPLAFAQNKVLFDATKAETAANADWIPDADLWNLCYNPGANTGCGSEANAQNLPTPAQSGITTSTAETYWKGALSAFAVDIAKLGYPVQTLPYNGQITFGNTSNPRDLANYKVFVVCEPNLLFAASEKTAILNWVSAGGSLLMVGNHNGSDRNSDGWDAPHIWNNLMAGNPFGITFDYVNISQTTTNVVTAANPITRGPKGNVTKAKWSSGTTMTLSPSANSTVKGYVYKTGSTQGNTNALVATAKYGNGRVLALGDSSPCDDGTGDSGDALYNGYTGDVSGHHRLLLLNGLLWLQGVTNLDDESGDRNGSELVASAHIFPNPADATASLVFEDAGQPNALVISDLQGKVIRQQALDLSENDSPIALRTEDLPNGIYLVRLLGGTSIWPTQKLVVQR